MDIMNILLIALLIVSQTSAISYNEPNFCPMVSWEPNATTFTDSSIIGQYSFSIFVNANNTVYVAAQDNGLIKFQNKRSISSPNFTREHLLHHLYPASVFVTSDNDIYVYSMHRGNTDKKGKRNDNPQFDTIVGTRSQRKERDRCCSCWWLVFCSCEWCDTSPSGTINPPNSNHTISNQTNSNTSRNNEGSHGAVYKQSLNETNTTIVMNVNGACFSLFVDINETIYCSMGDSHQVVKQSLKINATESIIAAGNGSNGSASNMLNYPFGIFVGINFDLYVADTFNNRIQRFRSGNLSGDTVAGGTMSGIMILSKPTGVVLDANGYLFIVDSGRHRIVRSGPNYFKCLLGCFIKSGAEISQLYFPTTISFDSFGNIMVLDFRNKRIQKFALATNICNESVTTLAPSVTTTNTERSSKIVGSILTHTPSDSTSFHQEDLATPTIIVQSTSADDSQSLLSNTSSITIMNSPSSIDTPVTQATEFETAALLTSSPETWTIEVTQREATVGVTELEPTTGVTISEAATEVTEPEATVEVIEPEATTGVTISDSSTEITESDVTTGVTQPEATTEVTQPVATTGVTEHEPTTGVTISETTAEETDPEATIEVTISEASTGITESEASVGVTAPEPTTGVTQSEATVGVTELEATIRVTEPEVTEPEATTGVTQHEPTTGVTEPEAKPGVTKSEATVKVTISEATIEVTEPLPSTEVTDPEPTVGLTEHEATHLGTAASVTSSSETSTIGVTEPSPSTKVTEPEATVGVTEPEPTTGVTQSEAAAGVTEPEATTTVTISEATTEVTTGVTEPETSVGITESEATIEVTISDASTRITESEVTIGVTQPEATTGVTISETSARITEPEPTTEITESEVTIRVTISEASTRIIEPEATIEVIEPEATAGVTQPEATIGVTISEVIIGVTGPEATTGVTISKTVPTHFVPPTCINFTPTGIPCSKLKSLCEMADPCQNNGTCIDNETNPIGYDCLCLPDFNGTDCQNDHRLCKPETCWNNGTCNVTDCICADGWEGRSCERMIDYCKNIKCLNGGICRRLFMSSTCECLDNYSGRECEIVATKIVIYKIVSTSFAYVGIIALVSFIMFIVIMDILKYCFGIDPVHKEQQRIRRQKRAKKVKSVVKRFVYVEAPLPTATKETVI